MKILPRSSLIRDFLIVRRTAERPLSHVVKVGNVTHFQPSRELREYAEAHARLPTWLRWTPEERARHSVIQKARFQRERESRG